MSETTNAEGHTPGRRDSDSGAYTILIKNTSKILVLFQMYPHAPVKKQLINQIVTFVCKTLSIRNDEDLKKQFSSRKCQFYKNLRRL